MEDLIIDKSDKHSNTGDDYDGYYIGNGDEDGKDSSECTKSKVLLLYTSAEH